jgi:hypothetical protein
VIAEVLEIRAAPSIDGVIARVRIAKAWKQNVPLELDVRSGTSCRYGMESNRRYVLYLLEDPSGELSTSRCVGNQTFDKAQNSLKWLAAHGHESEILSSRSGTQTGSMNERKNNEAK